MKKLIIIIGIGVMCGCVSQNKCFEQINRESHVSYGRGYRQGYKSQKLTHINIKLKALGITQNKINEILEELED